MAYQGDPKVVLDQQIFTGITSATIGAYLRRRARRHIEGLVEEERYDELRELRNDCLSYQEDFMEDVADMGWDDAVFDRHIRPCKAPEYWRQTVYAEAFEELDGSVDELLTENAGMEN